MKVLIAAYYNAGDEMFGDRRKQAYQQVKGFAEEHKVSIPDDAIAELKG